MVSFFKLYGQTSIEVDGIISKIYNLDFGDVPEQIEILKKESPQMAYYVEIDFCWWRMITCFNLSTESYFLNRLEQLKDTHCDREYVDYNRLIYFVYQMRYENYRNKSFSKYLTIIKFHFFKEHTDFENIKDCDPFIKCTIQLFDELDGFMKFKILNNYGILNQKDIDRCRNKLENIERINNPNYKSFDVIKTYLLGKIYLEIENNYQLAFVKFEKLTTMFPGNTIFKKALTDCEKHLFLGSIQ